MQLLNAAASFTSARQDLKNIYTTFVRSVLEQSSVVWHSSLSSENRKDLERLQKTAVRIILGKTYNNYKQGLKMLNLQTLNQRRKMLCLKFARKCLMNEKVRKIFPINTSISWILMLELGQTVSTVKMMIQKDHLAGFLKNTLDNVEY